MNPLINNNFIDSCAFDPKYEPEDSASIEIFKLSKQGKLPIQIAHSTQKEIDHPNTPSWVKREAQNLIFTINVTLTSDEINKLGEIKEILAGNGKVDNILQDARHIFEAQKYGAYFITTDARILSRTHALHLACGVTVLKPIEFLILVGRYLPDEGKKQPQSSRSNVSLKSEEVPRMNTVPYKGYVIEAVPYQLSESREWTINIYIRRDTGDQISFKNFSAANTFETKEEAIQHCINFGYRIIDGEIENCTASDL